jgi:phenylacetate-CoA ligase
VRLRACQPEQAGCDLLQLSLVTDRRPLAGTQPDRTLAALRSFFDTTLDEQLTKHLRVDPAASALEFVRGVAREVPAYARFLERVGVPVGSVALQALPPTTKDSYQRAFPLHDLCRGGTLERCDFLALSSGSTGEPAVWPRFVSDEIGTAWRFEQVLVDAMRVDERRTLGVICFALGSWVGGMYTIAACRHLAAKGYPITLVTPGNNRAEILRVVRALAPSFEQVVLFGYPPFLKDVVDAGRAEGVDWARTPVRLVTAGEVFSEAWRSLVCERLGGIDPALHTASLYGTADGGVLANETPLSISVRRFLAERPGAARELFGQSRLPTLCQYDPLHRYFEVDGDELLFSGDGGVPLVRYRILDRGGIVTFSEMAAFVKRHGGPRLHDLLGPGGPPVRELPFVYVFGRTHFALSFYGANVYPENVAIGLERPDVAAHVTGKFVMRVEPAALETPELAIAVELAPGGAPDEMFASRAAQAIRAAIEGVNSEFLHYAPSERRTPVVELISFGDPHHFPPGGKHRYTRE